MHELTEIADILGRLLRAYHSEDPENLGDDLHETVLIGKDVKEALDWLQRYRASALTGGMANAPRHVGQMPVDVFETAAGIEFRSNDIVVARLTTTPALNHLQTSEQSIRTQQAQVKTLG